jgi:fluoride exporter
MQAWILVGLGGALGSMGRYGVGMLAARLWPVAFPLATLLVNVAGSLAMGLLVGGLARFVPAWASEARLFVAVGVLGGFTTFSSFSLDTIVLIERGEAATALTYVLISVVVSILALYLGLLVTRGVAG